MRSKKEFFKHFDLYAVTNFEKAGPEVLTAIDKAYRGGAGIVQLRLKTVSDAEYIRLGLQVRQMARHYGRGFVINNRVDLALACDADAVHIGQDDIPVSKLQDILEQQKSEMLIGKSTHSLEQALEAEAEGVDYIGVGPLFSTPTKPDYKPVGLDLINQVRKKIKTPFVAIGGIDHHNLQQVMDAGASCVAVVRAIFTASDPYAAAQTLKGIYDRKILQKQNV